MFESLFEYAEISIQCRNIYLFSLQISNAALQRDR